MNPTEINEKRKQLKFNKPELFKLRVETKGIIKTYQNELKKISVDIAQIDFYKRNWTL